MVEPGGGQAGGPGQGAAGGRQQGGVLMTVVRMLMMWYFFKQFAGKKGADPNVTYLTPLMERESPVDVHFFITDDEDRNRLGWKAVAKENEAVWVAEDIPVAAGTQKEFEYKYRPSEHAQKNGSVLVHTVFTPHGASPKSGDDEFDSSLTWGFTRSLNTYLPKKKAGEGINLLSGKNSTDGKAMADDVSASNVTEIVSYLKPNVTVNFIDDFGSVPAGKIPPHLINIINVVPGTKSYSPHVYFNDFWLLRDKLVLMNDTVDEQSIHFVVGPIASWKAHMMAQMDNSFSLQEQWGISSGGEADEVKRIFLEGNPIFLALTVAVSMLHSVFDVLAFKNDIGFWKDNKSMKGLSARSIVINAVCQVIVFLYLLDNETSTVVLISSFVGTLIEFWKVTKAMDVSIQHTQSGIPYLRFKDKASYVQSQTDKYDADAMRYMSYVLYPLVAGYAVYALIYETHKSWYSWIVNSLVGAVYTFGFILMVPQLYLNYKLKSVAHLPWRQMTYKFLNTIIDDLFAFVIKMPLLHRLSVFRDDLIFVIYLYQRWIYRVDKTRPNEFGYAEEPSSTVDAVPAAAVKDQPKDDAQPQETGGETDQDGAGADTEESKKDK